MGYIDILHEALIRGLTRASCSVEYGLVSIAPKSSSEEVGRD
jgi:hypothetical protein